MYKKLAKKHNLGEAEVKKICSSPFLLMRKKIAETEFLEIGKNPSLNFGFKYLGIFYLESKRVYSINKIRNEAKDKSL